MASGLAGAAAVAGSDAAGDAGAAAARGDAGASGTEKTCSRGRAACALARAGARAAATESPVIEVNAIANPHVIRSLNVQDRDQYHHISKC